MDAVAYPDDAVIQFVNDNFIALRIPADDPTYGPRYTVKWTPALLVLDGEGTEHYRTLGFYPPLDLIPSLLLGMGKTYFNRADRQAASRCFTKVVEGFPKSAETPEAIYLNGVSRYVETHEVENLVGIYDRLTMEYPASPWASRAAPYRLLKKV